MSRYLNRMEASLTKISEKIVISFALFLYVASLFSVSFTAMDGTNIIYGYEALTFGFIQTILGLMGFFGALFQLQLDFLVVYALLFLPWLANIAMLLSFIFLYTSKNKNLCKITTIFGVICTSAFLLKPEATIGETMKIVPVAVSSGAYLWFVASLTLLLAYLFKSIPNKQINQDK